MNRKSKENNRNTNGKPKRNKHNDDKNHFWETLAEICCRSEGDVETRLIVPFLQALDWPLNEIHKGVPVDFQLGRKKRGRLFEADFVLAEARHDNTAPDTGWVVIEAKKPTETLDDSQAQAFSYSYALRAAFYFVTNSVEFELWQTGIHERCKQLLKCNKHDMYSRRSDWEHHLSRSAVKDYLKRARPPSTDIKDYDFHKYIDKLLRRTCPYPLFPRSLKLPNRHQGPGYKAGYSCESSLPFDNNTYYFLRGWGGQGKTSLLNLLSIDLLLQFDTNKRLPIVISAKWVESSLLETIAKQLEDTVGALGNERVLKQWIRETPTMIAIDDWEKIPDEVRDACIRDLEYLKDTPCAIIIASRDHMLPLPGFTPIEIEGFTEKEQIHFIQKTLGLKSDFDAKHYLEQAPDGFRQLLAEPIVLSKYVDLFETRKWHGFTPPQNLPALLDAVIESMVTTQRSRSLLHADEINDVCTALSTGSPITRSMLQKTLRKIGSQKNVDYYIEEMVGMGIWIRTPLKSYEYSHDLWLHHFAAKARFRHIATLESLRTWLSQLDPGTQRFDILFAVGLVRDRSLQDEFFDWLLSENPCLYIHALKGRASVLLDSSPSQLDPDTKKYCMEQLVKGYEDFVNRCVPGMKKFLDPWRFYEECDHDLRLDVLGDLNADIGRFTFRLSSSEKRTIKIGSEFSAWEWDADPDISSISWGQNIRGEIRPDSGRLMAVHYCLDQLEQTLREWRLPLVGWIGRESFIDYAYHFCDRGWINKAPSNLSVSLFRKWLCDSLPGLYQVSEEDHPKVRFLLEWRDSYESGLRTDSLSVQELISLADNLIGNKLGDSLITELSIPGHDGTGYPSNIDGKLIRTEDLYTIEEKRLRIKALLEASSSTYRDLCERAFIGLSPLMAYHCGPFRGRAFIEHTAERGTSITWCWEPTPTWDLPAQVDLSESRSGSYRDAYVDLLQQYAEMGRPLWIANLHWGRIASWRPRSRAVTEMVRAMLQEDMKRIKKMISSSH